MAHMTRRFPKKRFVPLGDLRTDRLGLSRRRGEELALIHAWARVAGPALAARTQPLGVRAGILDVRLAGDDEGWHRTLLGVLPRIAAGVVSAHPELRIDRVQAVTANGTAIGPPRELDRTVVPAAERFEASRSGASEPLPQEPLDDERLKKLMQAYLDRCSDSDGSTGP